jgi:hypothetical protein
MTPIFTAHAAALAVVLVVSSGLARAQPVQPAQPLQRPEVTNPRPLLQAALRSPDGVAHGVLSGELAQAITQRFGGTSPIFIDVRTERRFKQPGCSRLLVRVWQEGVRLPGAASPRTQTLDVGMNYCLDGRPPRSTE